MAGLAEDSIGHDGQHAGRPWGRWLLTALVGTLLVGGIATGLRAMVGAKPAPQRQVARISILPDTPPPPPPPKREDKLPEPPKSAPKEARIEPPKLAPAPAPAGEQIKMDGPAGDGPSAIAAGSVNQEYSGAAPGGGGAASAPLIAARPNIGIQRAAFSAYQLELQALIQDQLAKLPGIKQKDYRLPALVKLDERQQVSQVSLAGSSGSDELDRQVLDAVRNALLQRPPPSATPYRDFTIRVSNRLLN